ncbi:M20 metallopeptidase family protein [Pseudonocardia asaccharolytica]|uniref:N-acyl-L-amino acid amidohydrolase n=1 Tax=Pseudonocardia asaccharolytica DSM 44247 = NBRC 16224 TaxID=1123024 RepID=A0A511D3P7_9PSEU|nr:amidohydrolase [Pseudonocardia asaccharolytica]GEL19416.1 N-acyl-L-amino acid amidohydrolase [Pseudonocardia asaccharolytica DSM 44247 = NBRC 16224]
MTATLLRAVSAALEDELADAVELRHLLHAHPDLSGDEARTADRVVDALGGSEVYEVAATGRLIPIGGCAGPVVAVRAELDALPIIEDTGAPFAATVGAMHACGHDVHLAALVALARAVRRVGTPVPLLAVLQPREETRPSGALDLVREEAFTRLDVRAVIGAHLQPALPAGCVSATPGAVNASFDEVVLRMRGRGGHGAYPHLNRDPVLALMHALVAAHQIVAVRTDPMQSVVFTVGHLDAPGTANVIPDAATARGALRALREADRTMLHREVGRAVHAAAEVFGCQCQLEIHDGQPAVVNDERLAVATRRWLDLAGFVTDRAFRSCGSDDFAYYAAVAPSLMMFVGVGDGDTTAGLHSPRFLPPDSTVRDVARSMLAGYLAGVGGLG